MSDERFYLKYKICVSGAAETGHCSANALQMAKELGAEIVHQGAILVTGATTGIPYWSAIGAKEAGGFVVGLSPAASLKDHVKRYKLPVDYHDVIIYTGFEYAGRNLILTRAADAIITVCGRIGTLNEFTIAFEEQKPIGVLEESGGTADHIREIVGQSYRGPGKIVYSNNPKQLVAQVIALIKRERDPFLPAYVKATSGRSGTSKKRG